MLERTILKLPVERVIERAGNAHNYQIRVLGLFSIQWFLAAIIFVAYNFLFETPKLTCANSETPKFECTAQQACSGNFTYSYDLQNGPNTLISEFDLICDQEYFNSLGEQTFFLGAVMGSLYYADIQTKKDRLFSLVQPSSLAGLALMVSSLSFNIWLSLGFLFLANFGLFAYLNNSVIYFCEISSENLRLLGPNFFLIMWSFGRIVFSIVGSFQLSWKSTSFWVMGLPFFITCLFYRFMKGSPRFDVVNNRFEDAKASIRNMAKINNRPLPEFAFEYEVKVKAVAKAGLGAALFGNDDDQVVKINDQNQKNRSFMTLFKYNSLKMAAWVLLSFRILVTIVNHGNVLALNKFHDTTTESLMIDGVVEAFGYFFSCYAVLNFHRKNVLKTSFGVIGTVYILLSLAGQHASQIDVEESSIFVLALLFIGRIAICAAFGNLFVYITEVVPTSVRHFAFGLYAAAAYFAIIFVSAFVGALRDQNAHPQLILGVLFWLQWLLMGYLEETYNKPLLNNIREEDVFLTNPIEEMY